MNSLSLLGRRLRGAWSLFVCVALFGAVAPAWAETIALTLSQAGQPLAGQTVQAFTAAGADLGVTGTTDAAGRASFEVPLSSPVKFRLSRLETFLWSDPVATAGAFTFAVPADTVVKLTKGGAAVPNYRVLAYDEAGTSLNYTRITDADGFAYFALAAGLKVKFRADNGRVPYYTEIVATPASTALDLPSYCSVTVVRNGAPLVGATVHRLDAEGVDTGTIAITNAAGLARFTVPPGVRSQFRVTCDGRDITSVIQRAPVVFTLQIPPTTTVTVTKGGVAQGGVAVFVHDASGAYTGYTQNTGADGVARFCLDAGTSVKFRADNEGLESYTAVVTAPTAATLVLQSPEIVPVFSAATLLPTQFERGQPFTLTVSGEKIAAGSAAIDFLSAQGGSISTLALAPSGADWVATGTVPVNVPRLGGAGESVPVPVSIKLRSSTGNEITAATSFPLLNDTTPPTLQIDQPTTAEIDAPTTVITGRVGRDATTLELVAGSAAARSVAFDPADGRFSLELALGEGPNAFTLVGADFLGNRTEVPLALTRPARAPVLEISQPANPTDPVKTTTIKVAGTVTDASPVTLTINGVPVNLDTKGAFAVDQPLLNEGANVLTVVAEDRLRQKTTRQFTIYRITQAPTLAITFPAADPFVTRANPLQLAGTVGNGATKLTVAGVDIADFANGAFSCAVPLKEGSNAVLVEVADVVGNTRSVTRTVVYDKTPPAFVGLSPAADFVTRTPSTVLSGRVTDGQSLSLNGQALALATDGSFSKLLTLAEGATMLRLEATDAVGNAAVITLVATLDTIAPVVSISAPLDGVTVAADSIPVAGLVDDRSATLSVNGVSVANTAGAYSTTVALVSADTTIAVQAADAAGNTAATSITVHRDKTPPAVVITSPANNSSTRAASLRVAGTVDDRSAVVTVNGRTAAVAAGRFEITDLALDEGLNRITVVATDALGNASEPATVLVTSDRTAPAAPVLDAAPAYVRSDRVTLRGMAEAGATVAIDGGLAPVSAPADGAGAFSATVLLAANKANTLYVRATDQLGNIGDPLVYNVVADTVVPAIAITRPAAGASFTTSVIEVSGTVVDANNGTAVTVNGTSVSLSRQGQFACRVTLPNGNGQTVVVAATDLAGNQAQQSRTVNIADAAGDDAPPVIEVLSPAYDAVVGSPTFTASVLVVDESPLKSITIGGVAVSDPDGDGLVTAEVTADAKGEFVVTATDTGDREASVTHRVKLENGAPAAPVIQRVSPDGPTSESQVVVYATAPAGLRYELTGGIQPLQSGTVSADGRIVATVALAHNATSHLSLTVIGANGVASPAAVVDVVQDSLAPVVVATTPANLAQRVPTGTPITIVFSEGIRSNALGGVAVRAGGVAIACTTTLSSDAKTLTLVPQSALPQSAAVEVSLPATITDLALNPLGTAYLFSFATADLTAPKAPTVAPVAERTNQPGLTLTGSAEPLTRIAVAGAAAAVPATADAQGSFSVAVTLKRNATNELLVTSIDADGNSSPATKVTISHDDQPLVLQASVPADGATGVATGSAVALRFNKRPDPATLTNLAIVLGQSAVASAVTTDDTEVKLTPATALEAGKRYEVVIPANVADLFGNRLGETRRIGFTTLVADAPAVPVIYTAQPTGVTNLRRATISGFATPGTILRVTGGAEDFDFPATGTIDTTGLFNLEVPLRIDAVNSIALQTRTTDGRTSAPVAALEVRQDSIAPTVVRTTPQSGATDFPPRDFVFVEFSEAINGAALSGTVPAIRLFDAQGTAVPGSWALSGEGRGATFYPLAELTARTRYRLQVANTVRDLAGNPLGTTVTVEFTTGTAAAARPEAPVLDPLASSRTTATSVVITGSAAAGAQINAYGGQGGATTTADAAGRFTTTINLVPDTANALAFVAVVDGRVSEPATVTVTQVKHAVGIRILAPLAGRRYAYGAIEKDGVPQAGVTVCGVLDDPSAVESVTIGTEKATITGRYFFKPLNLPVSAGASTLTPTLTAVAHLKDGKTIESSVAIELAYEAPGTDTHPPVPHFIFPEPGEVLGGEVVECLVTVEENALLSTVYIDRVAAHQVVGNILFICAALKQGANTINVEATDGTGLVGTASVDVVCDSVGFDKAPTVVPVPAVTGDRVVELKGTAEPGSTIVVVNGLVPVRATVGADGAYSVRVPLNPNTANHLRVAMVDAAGNLSPVTVVDIEHDDAPPAILSTNPAGGQSGVAQNAVIEVVFSEAMAAESVTAPGAVVVTSARDKAVECNALLSADGKTLRITPKYKFSRGDTVAVSLAASLADTHGLTLGRSHFFNFATVNHQTTVSGIVVDPELGPLGGVRVGLLGTNLSQLTSSFGTFILDDAPVGDQILYVDARPSTTNGVVARSDGRQFNYLEFLVPVRRDADNSLGRPIFMVDTDLSTATRIEQTGSANVLTFKPATKDLAGFSITYDGGFVRFADGTTRGNLTATRIAPANIPDRLPSGAIPHFLVEIGPDRMVFDHPATLSFPNVYNLAAGAEVIVFHFKYGMHNFVELGRAKVGNDGIAVTGSILTESGFVGIVPADAAVDLTRNILSGRVVDAGGQGIAGVSVNAIAGDTYVVTDSQGNYSIPLPDVRLEYVRTFATVTTDLGARTGGAPSVVFQSELVTLGASGVTKVPDIRIESFFLGGSIRYVAADGSHISSRAGDGLVFNEAGELVSLDAATINNVDIFVYRRTSAAGEVPQYDSEPYMRTKADLPRFEDIADTYDSSYYLSFLGTLKATDAQGAKQTGPTPKAGDVVKIVAFDAKTGFYGEQDLTIPSASQGRPGATPLDVIVNLELRPPQVSLDINRVFFLEGIRRRANVPHRGIAFTDDEYVEIKTAWKTPAATPLDRAELSMSGRLRVTSVDYQTDYSFTVRGGEHFRVLELREALVADRLSILQRDTDVGIETISVSRDGSFTNASLLPLAVRTDTYGLAAGATAVAETTSKNVELYILNLTLAANGADLDVYGRFLPGRKVRIGGKELVADETGKFADKLSGLTGGIGVTAGDSVESVYGEVRAPHIRALTDVPPGLVPSTGGQGTRVVINGENFSPVPDDNKVSFNGAAAPVEHASETELVVTVPEFASSGDVTVTVAGRRSNGVHFEFFSIGINNGSFEDGTFRGFTLEGSGQVVEQWKRVRPTHNTYMAFLDTMENPRDGVSTLTTDEFELPTDAKRLLFDYNLVATALLNAPKTVLEFYIVAGSKTIQVGDLFDGVTLDTNSAVSGFEEGSGFRTAVVSLGNPEIPKGQRIRLRIVLKGRGALPEFIPGMNRYDHNPIGAGKNQGTGLFLDNFRLSFGNEAPLAPLDHSFIATRSDGTVAEVSIAAPGVLPVDARVYIYGLNANVVFSADVTAGGGVEFRRPWVEKERALEILISYATPSGEGGRVFAPQTFLRIDR